MSAEKNVRHFAAVCVEELDFADDAQWSTIVAGHMEDVYADAQARVIDAIEQWCCGLAHKGKDLPDLLDYLRKNAP